ncbi:MAG: aldo/keto reductase [Thermoleophilaceae bacterium]
MTPPTTEKPIEAGGSFDIAGKIVHRLCYGTMQLTGDGVWGEPGDRDEAIRVLKRAVELGVDFFDTADSYGPYVAEELLREALHPYEDQILIATKAGLVRTGPGEWHAVGRPEYLRQECEMSLRRLGLERIDLFQLHRIDAGVDRDEQFGLLRDLKDEGKIGAVGLSEVSVDDIEAARKVVEVATVQNLYNLTNRKSQDVLEYCEREGIGFIPWFPIASGELAKEGGPVDDVVKATGAEPSQVALAWLLRRSQVTLPIPGTSSVEHLEANCRAATLELSDDQVEELTRAAG